MLGGEDMGMGGPLLQNRASGGLKLKRKPWKVTTRPFNPQGSRNPRILCDSLNDLLFPFCG